jgi:hypothetical protein
MTKWYGFSRTNFVKVKDVQALRMVLLPFSIAAQLHPEAPNFVSLRSMTDRGDFTSSRQGDDEIEIEFSFEKHVVPHLVEGQVLLVQVVGNEKLRYLTGYAHAYAWDGRMVGINIEDITRFAAEIFEVPQSQIAKPSHQDLPEAYRTQALSSCTAVQCS